MQQNTTSSIADDHSYAVQSPTKLKAQNDLLIGKLAEKNARIRNLRKREVTKATKIEQLTSELKEHALLTEAAEHLLESYAGVPLHLFTARAGGTGGAFSVEQKHFALTMHYYSPAAYEYLRQQMPHLPSPRTIRGWLSTINGEPGLLTIMTVRWPRKC